MKARKRWRRRVGAVMLYIVLAVAVTAVAITLFRSDGGGDGNDQNVPSDLTPIGLGSRNAVDYDPPPGDESENGEQIPNLLDNDPSSFWATERYDTPRFANIKDGSGIYLDGGRPIVAGAIRITTPKPGWNAEFYVARDSVPETIADWTQVGSGEITEQTQTFGLDTGGQPFQYYLVWITKLTDGPNGRYSAGISGVQLLG